MEILMAKFAKCRKEAIIPSKREGDGCYDIYACFDDNEIQINPFEVKLIPTGICSTFSDKYRVGIRERGSNTKSCLITMAGQIDSNYTGEWFVALYNANNIPVVITKDVKEVTKELLSIKIPYSKAIAQFAFELVPSVIIQEISVDYIKSLSTDRGSGKLGSSGK